MGSKEKFELGRVTRENSYINQAWANKIEYERNRKRELKKLIWSLQSLYTKMAAIKASFLISRHL